MSDLERRFPEDYSIAELHAIATRALANGDNYERGLLREQLKRPRLSLQSPRPTKSTIAAIASSA